MGKELSRQKGGKEEEELKKGEKRNWVWGRREEERKNILMSQLPRVCSQPFCGR